MPAVDLKVYGAILSVRPARRFDIACLLMRMYGYMMNIGTVAMLSLAGYSFLESGLVSSVIALAIFLIGPRLGKLVDERGQSRVVPFAALVSLTGLVALLITVQFHDPPLDPVHRIGLRRLHPQRSSPLACSLGLSLAHG